jgi:hypothetical protein
MHPLSEEFPALLRLLRDLHLLDLRQAKPESNPAYGLAGLIIAAGLYPTINQDELGAEGDLPDEPAGSLRRFLRLHQMIDDQLATMGEAVLRAVAKADIEAAQRHLRSAPPPSPEHGE